MFEAKPPENLYRIMTDVRASSRQGRNATGQVGIVTLWVPAGSKASALARAALVLAERGYASVGHLHCYLEELANDPFARSPQQESPSERHKDLDLAAYDALKERALTQSAGLHEVWLGKGGEKSLSATVAA